MPTRPWIDCGHYRVQLGDEEDPVLHRPTSSTIRTFEAGLQRATNAEGSIVGVILGDIGIPARTWRGWHKHVGDAFLPPEYRAVLDAHGWPATRVMTISESGLRDAAQQMLMRQQRRHLSPEDTFSSFGWAVMLRRQAICGCDTPRSTEALLVVDPDRDDDAPLAVGLRGLRDLWMADGARKTLKTPLCSLLYAALTEEIARRGFDAHVAIYETEDPDIWFKLRGGAVVAAAIAGDVPGTFEHVHHVTDSTGECPLMRRWLHGEILEPRPGLWPRFLKEVQRRFPDVHAGTEPPPEVGRA